MKKGIFSNLSSLLTPHPSDDKTKSKATATELDITVKLESILLEEFRNVSASSNQTRTEVTNTFNYYLIVTGVVATGMGTLQTLIVQNDKNKDLMKT